MNIDYSYYLIADDPVCAPLSLENALESVIDYGITCVQLRMKNQTSKKIITTAKNLLSLLRPRNIPLIINDHVEIALAIDADGVHIGQSDRPYKQVRQLLGYQKIIGLSLENSQQALSCRQFDCDYFGVGPIFNTLTKKNAAKPLGIAQLKKIKDELNAPVVAIGGINLHTIKSVLATQVDGVAIASAIFSAECPARMTQQLASIIFKSNHAT